jgi:branched-chain amino acid transport system substrate-binding protein
MAKEAITLGMAISLSGRYALQGRQCLEGLECYGRDTNAAGGIFLKEAGKQLPVELKTYDDESNEDKVRELAEKLIRQDEVDLLLGPYGSNLTLAVAEIADAQRKVLWDHSGSADAIFAGNLSWVVGILTPASLYLCAILNMIKAIDPTVRRVALFHATTGFATDMADGALAWIEREGFSLVLHQPYTSGIQDFTPFLTNLAQDPPGLPDLLLGVGRIEDDILLGRQIWQVRPRVKAAGLVVAAISRFKAALREQADGFFAPSQWEPQVRYAVDYGPSEDKFLQHYLKSASVPIDYPAAQGYAAGLIAQRCVEESGTLDQRTLRQVAGRLRFTTFFGPYTIDPNTGRQIAHPMLVTQWQQGKKVIVWPKEVAEAEPIYPGPLWS